MSGTYKAYGLATKKKLKFVAGLEVYFKDPKCQISNGQESSKSSYFKTTLYAPDQKAFQKLSQLSSLKRKSKIALNGEEYGLWDWASLEEAAAAGCIACSSEINDIVGKHFLLNSPKAGLESFRKMISIFGQNYYLCLVGNKFDKYHITAIDITFEDGSKDWFFGSDTVETERSKRVRAIEVFENQDRHTKLVSGTRNGIVFPYKKNIKKVDLVQGNIPIESGDLQLKVNKAFLALSQKDNVQLIYSDYAYYASADDKIVQDVRLYSENKKEYVKRHMQSSDEAFSYLSETLGLPEEKIKQISENQTLWLSKFDNFKLKYDVRLPEVDGGQDSLELTMKIIKETGRMKWDNPEYVARLKREIEVIAKNGVVNLLPYFFPIKKVLDEYKKKNEIVGACRGSAGGSLLLYLMGVTQLNPLKYGLSFERFLSLARVLSGSYPDVDTDLPSRDLLVGKDRHSGFLYGTWGDRASQISTRTLLRLKSSITDVNRYFNGGKVEEYIKNLTKSMPAAPTGVSDHDFVFGYEDDDGNHIEGLLDKSEDLKMYTEKKPEEWAIVQKCLGISRQTSAHASAFIIADRPVKDTVPLFNEEFTQYEAKEIEKAGMIKYDFLVVKQLEDVQLAMNLINKKSGKTDIPSYHFWHGDVLMDIMNLPEEIDVFKSVWEGQNATLFQISTSGMSSYCKKLKPKNTEDGAVILALYRPGPLDFVDPKTNRNMAEEYIERRFGRSQPDIKELADLLPETYGIMVYQEQVSKVSVEIGGMKPDDAEELRRVFSKKDKKKSLEMKPVFMENAVKNVGQEKAETIWNQMETFSRYGFNKSHAVGYFLLTYQSMYLRHHYPLEWWSAVLSNADEGEISTELFKYVKDLVVAPDINYSTNQMTIDYDKSKIRAKLGVLKGAGDKSIAPIIAGAPYSDIKDFVRKDVAGPALTKRLIHVGAMDSLFDKNDSLLQKMQKYEDAVLENKHEIAVKAGKKTKPLAKGEVDDIYLSMSPLKDFQLKKAIFPTMPASLSELYLKYASRMKEGFDGGELFSNSRGMPTKFWSGDAVKRFDNIQQIGSNVYFCAVGYIVDCKEFSFSKNTKKALKLVVDFDGHVMEKVMWPDYETGKLSYPKDLKTGSIALLFMSRRATKQGADSSSPSSISEIILESV